MTPLVIGVGNPARGDDGVGPAVAELVAADRRLAGASVRTVVQLAPELAADIAQASVVVIVDARAGAPPGRVEWAPAEPDGGQASIFSHHLTPQALLRLAVTAYGRVARAFVIGVGALTFDVGAPLSPEVTAALPRAVDLVVALLAGDPTTLHAVEAR